MESLISNYYNGNIAEAKKQAAKYKASDIIRFMEDLNFSKQDTLVLLKDLK